MIDGILHVDYESLIPYLSESIKQNFNDIQGIKSDTKRLEALLDKLYEQFTKTETPAKAKHYHSKNDRPPSIFRSKWTWLAGVVFLVLLGATAVTVGLLMTSGGHDIKPSPVPRSESATKLALKSFYTTMNGDNWKIKTNWMSDRSICEWYGITCQEPISDELITAIKLPDNNLHGELVDQAILFNISTLREVDLSQNNIRSDIAKLSSSITHLNLAENDITADISSFNQLTNIQYLNLAYTKVYGEFSFSVGQLGSLKALNVSHTALSSYTPGLMTDVEIDACDWSEIPNLVCDGPECIEHDGTMKCDVPRWLTRCGGTCRWSNGL